MTDTLDWLLEAVGDAANGWSVGTFGVIAEFVCHPEEPVELARSATSASAATPRGAIRISSAADLRPVAYQTPNRDGVTWSHAVALCLPTSDCAGHRRDVLTEIGPDREAVRPGDQDAILFDLGLALLPVDACVRTRDPQLIAALRAAEGKALFDPGHEAMGAILASGPHRVFICRLGRAEVFQPIPPPDGRSPEGPHTHLLPKLLRAGRTHSATTPIPEGWTPCGHLYPPGAIVHDTGPSLHVARHASFERLSKLHGPPTLVEAKREAFEAMRAGRGPHALEIPLDRHVRAAVRVAIREASLLGMPGTESWSAAFDLAADHGPADEDERPAH